MGPPCESLDSSGSLLEDGKKKNLCVWIHSGAVATHVRRMFLGFERFHRFGGKVNKTCCRSLSHDPLADGSFLWRVPPFSVEKSFGGAPVFIDAQQCCETQYGFFSKLGHRPKWLVSLWFPMIPPQNGYPQKQRLSMQATTTRATVLTPVVRIRISLLP